MSLLDHLEELRRRLFYSLIAFFVALVACSIYVDPIFDVLEMPIRRYLPPGKKLVIFGVPDAFLFYFKVAALAALFLAAPYILYQVWCFIAPGLYRKERRWTAAFVLSTTLFFLGGGLFAYFIASPFAIQFLLELGSRFEPVISADRYLGFEMTVIAGAGLMFELPVVIFALAQLGLVTPAFLMRNFRWAVLIIFIVAAVVTPTPDVVNLCVFALPAILLYLLGAGAAWVVARNKRKRELAAESAES
ncbi:MAG: twin-arginine translocase subunit TatC [Thermoanaerobaculia bacterium]